jgi:ribosomal-protein-alanine N-acetyltransferase
VEASRRLWAAGRSALGLPAQAGREAATSPKVVGFAALHRTIDEVELRNMAVDPEHQHQGVGKALLKEAWQRLVEAGAKRVFLEVRASNNGALQFYYSLGFALYSRRNNYYSDPAEDAFVLALGLSPQAQRRPLRLHRGQPVAGQASCGPGFHSGE